MPGRILDVLKGQALAATRAAGVLRLARHLTRGSLMIVGWHGVSQLDEHRYFPGLYITPETLRERLRFLVRHYTVVSLQEAVLQLEQGHLRPRQVVLTFDDGNYDFHARAVPILREFGVPATNFIITSYIERHEPSWNLLGRYILRKGRHLGLAAPTDEGLIHEPTMLARLSHLSGRSEREHFLRQLAAAWRVDFDEILTLRLMDALRLDELRELAASGVDFQMHGHEHKNAVDYAHLLPRQVCRCRELLAEWIGRAPDHFCYPSGRWNAPAREVLASHGVRSAITTATGPNLPATHRLSLRRVLNGENNSALEFELAMSNLAWLLRSARRGRRLPDPPEQLVRYGTRPAAGGTTRERGRG